MGLEPNATDMSYSTSDFELRRVVNVCTFRSCRAGAEEPNRQPNKQKRSMSFFMLPRISHKVNGR